MSSTLTTHILAQEGPGGIDGAIQSVFGPFVDFLETAVFFSVPILGADLPLVVVWLVAGGVFCNVYLRVRPIKDAKQAIRAVRGMLAKKSDPGQVTSFQAFATELAGTIGLGNIAGVAVAITMGGPGASFWIAAAGVLGMAVKLAEATLGQMFRRVNDDGTVAAGPMYFLEYGLKSIGKPKLGRSLGFFYAIGMAFAVMGAGNIFQANQVAMHLTDITGGEDSFLFGNGWIVGLAIAIPAAVVLIGGINSIANATSRPFGDVCARGCCFSWFLALTSLRFRTPSCRSSGHSPQKVFPAFRCGHHRYSACPFSNVAGVGTAALAWRPEPPSC